LPARWPCPQPTRANTRAPRRVRKSSSSSTYTLFQGCSSPLTGAQSSFQVFSACILLRVLTSRFGQSQISPCFATPFGGCAKQLYCGAARAPTSRSADAATPSVLLKEEADKKPIIRSLAGSISMQVSWQPRGRPAKLNIRTRTSLHLLRPEIAAAPLGSGPSVEERAPRSVVRGEASRPRSLRGQAVPRLPEKYLNGLEKRSKCRPFGFRCCTAASSEHRAVVRESESVVQLMVRLRK
jgi:hypothetical protein